ncbi:hypothetical protein [Sphingomonas sp.]|uniref:hypothetical protein n=1 Tax=Sphingomonas sp. TaxID=28214 RepID=UPI00286AE22F|nr:hypothetical protein [Sphingomonas sp.]
MADSGLAYDPDRLPWLVEERKPRRQAGKTPLLLWALLAAMILAGGSYWLGMRTASQADDFTRPTRTSPAATVTLPQPRIVEPQVRPAPMPDVQPVAEPAPVRISQATPVHRTRRFVVRRRLPPQHAPAAENLNRVEEAQAAQAAPAVVAPKPLQAWPAAVSEGAYGRVVRIGTFSSRRSAKLAWWRLVRHYPGMKRLKAVVAPVRSLRNGQIYYRLQFGTTSQAHSEVLCQRMRIIAQSCVVVGLPKP